MGETAFAIPISSEEVIHSGVKGMKWYEHKFGDWERHAQYAAGQPNPETEDDRNRRNGIIDRVKAAAEERAERKQEEYESAKQKTLQSGTAQDILKYKGELTNQELQTAISRLNLERQLKDINDKDNYVETGWDKADKIFSKVGKVSGYINTTANAMNSVNNLVTSGENLFKMAMSHTKAHKEHQKELENNLRTKSYDELAKDWENLSKEDRDFLAKSAQDENKFLSTISQLASKRPKDQTTTTQENQNGTDKVKDAVDKAVESAKELNNEAREKSDPDARIKAQDDKYMEALQRQKEKKEKEESIEAARKEQEKKNTEALKQQIKKEEQERAAKKKAEAEKAEQEKRAANEKNFRDWDNEMNRVRQADIERRYNESHSTEAQARQVDRDIAAKKDEEARAAYNRKVAEGLERVKNAPVSQSNAPRTTNESAYSKVQSTLNSYADTLMSPSEIAKATPGAIKSASDAAKTSIDRGRTTVGNLFNAVRSINNSNDSSDNYSSVGKDLMDSNRSLLNKTIDFLNDDDKKR